MSQNPVQPESLSLVAAGAQHRAIIFLRGAILAADNGPAAEFLLIPFGSVEVDRALSGRSFEFTPAHAQAAKQWFDALGRNLAIDYEHQSFDRFNTRPDGLKPAAGWIGGVEVREDGLWATGVAWTNRARELLASGEYRYFSPVIYWSDEDYSALTGLGPVGLTNDPAMRGVAPLSASRHDDSSPPVDAQDGEGGEAALRQRLHDAEQQIVVLQQSLQSQAADGFIERGMRLGKIVESTASDWREDFLRDARAAEMRLCRAPVLLAPGRIVQAQKPLHAAARTSSSPADESKQDLEAFETAMNAGRVLMAACAG